MAGVHENPHRTQGRLRRWLRGRNRLGDESVLSGEDPPSGDAAPRGAWAACGRRRRLLGEHEFAVARDSLEVPIRAEESTVVTHRGQRDLTINRRGDDSMLRTDPMQARGRHMIITLERQ